MVGNSPDMMTIVLLNTVVSCYLLLCSWQSESLTAPAPYLNFPDSVTSMRVWTGHTVRARGSETQEKVDTKRGGGRRSPSLSRARGRSKESGKVPPVPLLSPSEPGYTKIHGQEAAAPPPSPSDITICYDTCQLAHTQQHVFIIFKITFLPPLVYLHSL